MPGTLKSKTMPIVALLLILSAAAAGAQESAATAGKVEELSVFEEYPSSLGVSLATLESFGLSWKRWYGRTGFEIAAGGMWDPATADGTIYWYSVTGAMSYRLYAEDFAHWFSGGLYLVLFGGHGGEDSYTYVYDDSLEGEYVRTGYQPYVYLGAGIGIETVLFRHFSQELQFLYIGQFISDPRIGFNVNASFRYRF